MALYKTFIILIMIMIIMIIISFPFSCHKYFINSIGWLSIFMECIVEHIKEKGLE